MSYKKKKAEFTNKRLEFQLYLAKENPEPIFDLSNCELELIPSTVCPLCKVLQKECLLLNNNKLSSLKKITNFQDLISLKILDLSYNHLEDLPNEFGALLNLEKLNLMQNKLKKLPETFNQLNYLQVLNLKNNKFKLLPISICSLTSLTNLNISGNQINQLPTNLSLLFNLQTLILDTENMIFPPFNICQKGKEAILEFLKIEFGLANKSFEFEKNIAMATANKLNFEETLTTRSATTSPTLSYNSNYITSSASSESDIRKYSLVMNYENLKEIKRKQQLNLEEQLNSHYTQQAMLSSEAAANKKHLINFISKEHEMIEKKLDFVYRKKMSEKERLFDDIAYAENNVLNLISNVLENNEKSKNLDALLFEIEKERQEQENIIIQKQEELENNKKNDILKSMENILKENNSLDSLFKKKTESMKEINVKNIENSSQLEQNIENIFNTKKYIQNNIINTISQEELLQREAYALLCCQRDVKRKNIIEEIQLIEEQLQHMTKLELQQRALNVDNQLNQLIEKREMLTKLLMQLLNQKKIREKELHAKLLDKERFCNEKMTDYWLVKYKLLLESKPEELILKEKELDIEIENILLEAGASKYLSFFAHNRISLQEFLSLNIEAIQLIGVHNTTISNSIFKEIQRYKKKMDAKMTKSDNLEPTSKIVSPTAPPLESPTYMKARGLNSECVICLNRETSFLLLPCGHVCVCDVCVNHCEICPLDRTVIIQKIFIEN